MEDVLVGRVRLQLVHFDFVQEVARSKRECRPLLLTVPADRGHFGPAAHLLRSLLAQWRSAGVERVTVCNVQ